jgi:hypothetical protein
MNDDQRRQQFIDGLRAVAHFYEQDPAAYYDGRHITLNMYVWGSDAPTTLARAAGAFGHCNKLYDENNVTVSRQFSPQVTLAVFAPRAKVCKRLPAAKVDREEWQCDP